MKSYVQFEDKCGASLFILGLASPASSGMSILCASLTFTQACLKKLLKCLEKVRYIMIPVLIMRFSEILLHTGTIRCVEVHS